MRLCDLRSETLRTERCLCQKWLPSCPTIHFALWKIEVGLDWVLKSFRTSSTRFQVKTNYLYNMGMRSVARVTEKLNFSTVTKVLLRFSSLIFLNYVADLSNRTHDLCDRTHDLSSRTHDLCDRTHDLCSRMHDLGSCRLSESVLCRMQVAISQCLKVARHGLKVAQRVLHVLLPSSRIS